MVKKEIMKRTSSAVLCAAVVFASIMPAFAADGTGAGDRTAVENDLANADIMDTSKTGSITIHKYDMTAASAAGDYAEGDYDANGMQNAAAEKRLEQYAVSGVRFTYLKAGEIEQYSERGEVSGVSLVYEIPEELASVLQLDKGDAYDMTANSVTDPCENTGVLHFDSRQISEALADILAADDVIAKNALESYVYDFSGDKARDGAVTMPETDADGVTSAANLPLGLYLIVETGVPEEVTDTVNPWFVSLPFTNEAYGEDAAHTGGDYWVYDNYSYPKNQTGSPTLDKKVRAAYSGSAEETEQESGAVESGNTYADAATASTGDLLDYVLVSRLPHISSSATYLTQFTFKDVLSDGLRYNDDVKVAFYHARDDALSNNTAKADLIWIPGDAMFSSLIDISSDKTDASPGETSLLVSFTEDGLAYINGTADGKQYPGLNTDAAEKADVSRGLSDFYLVVYYTATVEADSSVVLGDKGNPNDVTLTWSRTSNPEVYYDTLEDRCIVYTYALDLTKNFSDNKGDASRVQFKLYNTADAYYVTAAGEEGLYYVKGKTVNEAEATAFVPGQDGRLVINGIEGDTYSLTEVATDDGYSLLKDQIRIDIQEASCQTAPTVSGTGEAGGLIGASATVDGADVAMKASGDSPNAVVALAVTNTRTFLLPQTGGRGLYLLTIVGILVVGAGCHGVCRSRTKKKAD